VSSKSDSRKLARIALSSDENAYRDVTKIDRLKLPQRQIVRIFKAVKSLEDDPRPARLARSSKERRYRSTA
jgi:hypothetical protein